MKDIQAIPRTNLLNNKVNTNNNMTVLAISVANKDIKSKIKFFRQSWPK